MSNQSASAPRSLADQFRNWSDEQLASLLQLRPELGTPAPANSRALASRAVEPYSTRMALTELNSFQLLVLQSWCQEDLLAADPAEIESATELLTTLGLVWGDPPTPTSTVRSLLSAASGPDQLQSDRLTPPQLELLQQLDQQYLDGTFSSTHVSVTDLFESGWLSALDDKSVRLTWRARLALRRHSGRPLAAAPEVPTTTNDPMLVDRMAAGAAFEFCRRVALLLDRWSQHPPPALRSGGLGVRDLKAVTQMLHVDTWEAGLIVEVAQAAGLLGTGHTDELNRAWLPTEEYDAWQQLPLHRRWLQLAFAWLDLDRQVTLIGSRIDGKPVNALTPALNNPSMSDLRHDLLEHLPQTVGETLAAATGLPALGERIQWAHPMRSIHRLKLLPDLIREATAIGAIGLDGLSTLGLALFTDDTAADAPWISSLFPTPIEQVLIQADLTAVAPGPLTPELATKLALLTQVESHGGATVHRFSAKSIRNAFDAGWTAKETHDFLAQVSRTPVPQPLTYLVDDVARRFGTLRIGQVESFLRSEDPTILNELLHNPKSAGLRLRRIAPTVLLSELPLDSLLGQIRELDLAPVVEAPDGSVQVSQPEAWRAGHTQKRIPPDAYVHSIAHIRAVVNAIRVGDQADDGYAQQALATSPVDIIATLHSALETGRDLLISYVGDDGTSSPRIVIPLRVEHGSLLAQDRRTGVRRSFSIHRISRLGAL